MKLLTTLFFLGYCLNSVAQEPIIIGVSADMTAVAKEGGIAIVRGAEIAIDEINEQGGILNRPLKLIVKNHRGNPARGVNNIKQFSALNNLVAVIGGVHTPVALKELPLVHHHKIIYLDPWAAGTSIVDNGYQPNYVFRISVRDEEAAKVMIALAKKRGFENVGLLLERTGWGRSNEVSLKASAKHQQVEISKIVWFNWGQKNLENEIDKLYKAGAKTIILVANVPEGVAFSKGVLKRKDKLPIISHWGIASGDFVKQLGLESIKALDISVLQTYSFAKPTNNKLNDDVLKRYQNKYGKEITSTVIPGAVGTAHAYDLVHLLAKAISAAGSTDRAIIRNELELLPTHKGLVKTYQPAFTNSQHDALLSADYMMSTFNHLGNLVPIQE